MISLCRFIPHTTSCFRDARSGKVTGPFAHFPVRPESFRPRVVSPSITWVVSPSYPESFRPYLTSRFARYLNLHFIEDIVKILQFLFPSMKILLHFFKKW